MTGCMKTCLPSSTLNSSKEAAGWETSLLYIYLNIYSGNNYRQSFIINNYSFTVEGRNEFVIYYEKSSWKVYHECHLTQALCKKVNVIVGRPFSDSVASVLINRAVPIPYILLNVSTDVNYQIMRWTRILTRVTHRNIFPTSYDCVASFYGAPSKLEKVRRSSLLSSHHL